MTYMQRPNQALAEGHANDFPALTKLELSTMEFDALARQGFVCEERRRDTTYYKLRYRLAGKQRVRYIGEVAAALVVKRELASLQQNARSRRQVTALRQVASKQLREAKQLLQPYLQERGLYYHGQAIRKRRSPRISVPT
jgi:hypothetical protein